MTDAHGTAHEARLLELAGIDGEPREALGRSELADCAGCARFVEELEHAEAAIAIAGREQQALLREAVGSKPAPGEERAIAELRRRATSATQATGVRAGDGVPRERPIAAPSTSDAPEPRSSLDRRVWLAAAALVLAFAAAWLLTRAPERDVRLGEGGGAPVLEHPVGAVDDYAPFAWKAELPPRGWFVVRVEGRRADGTSTSASSAHLLEARWDPGSAATSDWPDAIDWELHVYDASGRERGSASASATRTPR